MPPYLPILIFCLAFPALGLAESGGVYKWTDDAGSTHYTQFPPTGRESVKVRAAPPPAEDPQAALEKMREKMGGFEERQKQQRESVKQARTQEGFERTREENCEIAHNNMAVLQQGGNQRYRTADGQIIRMTEEDKQARISETEQQIKDFCNP